MGEGVRPSPILFRWAKVFDRAQFCPGGITLRLAHTHDWNLTVDQAKAVQAALAEKVVPQTTFAPGDVQTVAGVDVSFRAGIARAAVVVLSVPDLKPVDQALAEVPVTFPYVPGLLAFREGPCALGALERLGTWPDLFLFDAQGIAHPRRLGLAAHLGVVLDAPSIGCAKSRLCGEAAEPGPGPGDWVPLTEAGEVIGAVLRTQPGARPLYVSIGHRVDLPAAVEMVLRCVRRHRLPEPLRLAHLLAGGTLLTEPAGAL